MGKIVTSPDPEVERLQREYEQACVAWAEKRMDGEKLCSTHGMAVERAREALSAARQRAAQQQSDEEIAKIMGDAFNSALPGYREFGGWNTTYIFAAHKAMAAALSALRAAGFEIRRRA